MKKFLLMAAAALVGVSASAQTTYYSFDGGTPAAVESLVDGEVYFIYDAVTNGRNALRYNRNNAPYYQILGDHVTPAANQMYENTYLWKAVADGDNWKFMSVSNNAYFPAPNNNAGGNIDLGSTSEENAGVFSLTSAGENGQFYVRSVSSTEYVWDGNGDDDSYKFTFWNAGNGHPYQFFKAVEVKPLTVTINSVLGETTIATYTTSVAQGSTYSTPAIPAEIGTLSEVLTDVTLTADKTLTLTVAENAQLFKLVCARYNGVWANSNATGLTHTANGSSYADGEYLAQIPSGEGIKIFNFKALSFVGDFNQGSQAPFAANSDNAAVFTIEHNQNGPVAIKAPSGTYFNDFNGFNTGIIGGWSAGEDSGSYWFMVSDEDAYAANAPYFWNEGAAIDSGSGNFTNDNAWYEAQQKAKDAIAAAKERGATEADCAALQTLVDNALTADFGAADVNIHNMIEELSTATTTLNAWTGIEEIVAGQNGAKAIYDLQGRRLAAPVKGINIINGRKVLVK